MAVDSAAAAQIASNSATRSANADYLARCIPQVAVCPPTNGGITQAFTAGQQLFFNLPTADNAMATDLLITSQLTINAATGTSATYAANAGAPWTIYDRIIVLYNGTQVQTRPILMKYYWILRGFAKGGSWQVVAGTSVASIQAYLFATTIQAPGAAVATGNSVWNWVFRLPLRALHELNHLGVLPVMGQGTKGQVIVNCALNLMGADPLLNVVANTGGSGNAVTCTGTVKVECIYMDGTTFWSTTPLVLDLVGEPTAQYYIDVPLTNIAAGIVNRQAITTLLQHYLVLSLAIDGQQSNKFSTNANISELEFDKDSVGRSPFYLYGAGSNVSVYDFFERFRQYAGQDLDEGVIPWICAWLFNQQDPDLKEGVMVLNMTSGGWTDAHYGIQFTAIGGLGAAVPVRLETMLISLNPQPLITTPAA